MADELELLRGADPVPPHGPHFGDGPLDHNAERRLERLLRHQEDRLPEGAGPHPGRLPWRARPLTGAGRARWSLFPGRARARRGPGPGRLPALPLPGSGRLRLAWGLVATAVVAALALTLVLSGASAPPAVAAPRPLVVVSDSTPVSLDRMAERAAAAVEVPGAPRLRKGTHVRSWSLGMSDSMPPITLPEERIVRWRADDSHTELVVATDPGYPGRPVLSDAGGTPHLVGDGHVLLDRTYPPSWSDAPPHSPPPTDPARLRAYLTESQFTGTPLTTPELLDAMATLLDHWTLGARQSAALARLLAGADGLRPAGRVTDRLGRPGQAYVNDCGGVRHMLIMDPGTGAVLGLESTLIRPEPAFGAESGDVMSYSAWMR
ncbi:CU044_5270 family protein [Streptomyces sp. NPDC059696]|uniref:CU044_5270 family protein n=1 Tax=Streptomyces sp. NPDC059696 TaxID=3346911 RepID=UPI0036803F88